MNWKNVIWTPSIGDPTVAGWVIVAGYFLTAGVALSLFLSRRVGGSDRIYWMIVALLMLFLGVNKQLDLQTLLTQVGKEFVKSVGLYPYRIWIQVPFAILFVVMMIYLGRKLGGIPSAHPRIRGVATIGLVILLSFVSVRALSIHHVDRLLALYLNHFVLNQIFEFVGISVVFLGGILFAKKRG